MPLSFFVISRRLQATSGRSHRAEARGSTALLLALFVEADDLHLGAELVEHLAARAAGITVVVAAPRDNDALEFSVSLAHGLECRGALGAVCQPVARIFDVAAGEDRAVLAFKRRADGKMRIRHIGHLQHGDGLCFQLFQSCHQNRLLTSLRRGRDEQTCP